MGERQDVPDVLSALDMFCQSSVSEGFPNALAEAMAVGVPCVATDVGYTQALVGDAGLLVPPRQPEALAASLEENIHKDPPQRYALSESGKKRIVENYSMNRVVNQYTELYSGLMQFGKLSGMERLKGI